MLADVIRYKREEIIKQVLAEMDEYNKLYKRDTIIYFSEIHCIGGIERWIENLSRRFEFSVLYDKADLKRLNHFKELGIETIKNVGQPIECDTLIRFLWGGDADIKAKKKILFIHGIYNSRDEIGEIPESDEIYAVSKYAASQFKKVSGREAKVLYNPVDIEKTTKPLFLGVFSRLSNEKGRWRIEHIIDKLEAANKPFFMFVFTDLPFECDSEHVAMITPELNPTGWMEKCDYILNPSDTEAGPLTIQESLKLGKPVIVTKLPILEEFGIDKTNAKILEFDMTNLDVEDLWNIPKVKWQEPISKEWDEIMKKRVFREKQTEISPKTIETALVTEEITEKTLKSPSKTKKKVK